ncbi:hypothetical protein WR25_10789 isoform A [Diploscapter pachys]|uniref:Malectin domain-containing protein n=1 Tax=Diploscapter pachys TaxID=2018661 RepID=A0A2A2JBK4_9BILA|nr:hypothetical protein WR25_10789 isoform A [Diploscapter pachys]
MQSPSKWAIFAGIFFVTRISAEVDLSSRVVHAVNCGGPSTKGAYGILYEADPHNQGTASDHGKRYAFMNAPNTDRVIYESERWSPDDLTYTFKLKPGKYALILKFSEVYFEMPGQKIFDVLLNGITLIKDLDIFGQTHATGLAHDRYFGFEIVGKELRLENDIIGEVENGELEITFAKGANDNPKINGIVVLKGSKEDLPQPPAAGINEEELAKKFDQQERDRRRAQIENDEDSEQYEEQLRQMERMQQLNRENQDQADSVDRETIASGPPVKDPHGDRQDNTLIWIVGTIVAAIPIIYLLRSF